MAVRMIQVAAGIVRQKGQVLLVQQQGPEDAFPTWGLPGGVVQEGELLFEAFKREVREESGLEVRKSGELAYLVQVDHKDGLVQSEAFVFEVEAWSGVLKANDPDGLVMNVEFTPVAEAVQRLHALPWRWMSEPAVAYLRGDAPAGKVWSYKVGEDGAVDE